MKEKLTNFLDRIDKPTRGYISVGVAAFGTGVALGYFLGRRRKEESYTFQDQLEFDFNTEGLSEKVEEVKVISGDVTTIVEPKVETIERGREFFEGKLEEEVTFTPEEPSETEIRQNIFAHSGEDWNYEEEVKKRNPDEPYVIHKDEFYEDERGFTQSTLSYYAGDDIMADEDDKPIYNYKSITGPLLFGHGSGDPNVVHIRNEKRRAEYEILLHQGLFSQEVLGLEIEENERARDIRHSHVPKFRSD